MKSRSRLELWALILVCFGPMVVAYWLYFHGEPRSLPVIANEERLLIDPALPLPAMPGTARGEDDDNLWNDGRWSLVHARVAPCDEPCLESLLHLSQVHAALGRDSLRVQRVYLGPGGDALREGDRGLVTAPLDTVAGGALLDTLDQAGAPPGGEGRIYLVDPHGNLVLSYPADPEQEGLLKDLDRLLAVSRIG